MAASAAADSWTHEDELACYRVVRGADVLEVYDQGVFVRFFRTWQLGVGGLVVSKEPLEINVTRSAAMEPAGPVWSRIRTVIEALIVRELAAAQYLTDSQRKFLGLRLPSLPEWVPDPGAWKGLKLLTDPTGKHLPLSALVAYRRFVHIPEAGAPAGAAHGTDSTFVVTDALLDRFGMDSLRDWLALLSQAGLLPEDYSVEARVA